MVARLLSDTERVSLFVVSVVVFDAALGVTLRLFGYACKQTRTHILTLNHICEVRGHLHVVALGQILESAIVKIDLILLTHLIFNRCKYFVVVILRPCHMKPDFNRQQFNSKRMLLSHVCYTFTLQCTYNPIFQIYIATVYLETLSDVCNVCISPPLTSQCSCVSFPFTLTCTMNVTYI